MNKPGDPPHLDGALSETRARRVEGETACDPEILLDLLATLLADEEEVGGSSPDQTCNQTEAASNPLFQSRLDRARDCLQLLRIAWSRPGGAPELEPTTRAAGSEPGHNALTAMQSPARDQGTEADGPTLVGGEAAHERDKLGPRKIGRFTILRELGQGGFGIVYLAHDPTLSRLVALKLPRLEILASTELKRRFLVEAQAAARLDHPNILPIYDVGELGPDPSMGLFIASAYCRDGSLSGWIARQHAAIAPRLAARLLLGLAQGVEHLHEQGILHRDLKPSNVLLQRSGPPARSPAAPSLTPVDPVDPASIVPRIADFGLARLLDQPADQTQSGHPLGSPPYMSPEQAEGRISAMGPATDIYGLGAILYSLLVGRPPFRAETPALTIRQVIEDEPVAPRKLRPGLPRDLETICLTCLHKSPERRYASAAALREDLIRWLEGQPIHARPVSTTERAIKWARRRPAIAALSVFLFLAVTLGISGVFSQWRRAEESLLHALRSEDLSRRQAYAVSINLASRDYESGNVGRVRKLLDDTRPSPGESDLRGFEWYYLEGLCRSTGRDLTGHTDTVWAVAFSPDAKTLATGGDDRTVRLWDVATGRMTQSLQGPNTKIRRLAFHPDGIRLATGGGTAPVLIWDTRTGKVLHQIPAHQPRTLDVAFSPDGKVLATAGADRKICLWDVESGKNLFTLEGHTRPVFDVGFNPAGELLASAGEDGHVKMWDTASGRIARDIPAHNAAIQQFAFSPNGANLATAATDGIIKLWKVGSGELVASFPMLKSPIWCVAFSTDGSSLASGSVDGLVRIWNVATRKIIRTLRGHSQPILDLAFSPKSRLLASAGGLDLKAKLWDPDLAHEARALSGVSGAVYHVRYSPDGNQLAAACDGGSVALWDLASGRLVRSTNAHTGSALDVRFRPDGLGLASSGQDGQIKLWTMFPSDPPLTLHGHPRRVININFSPDGARLASAGDDSLVRMWNSRDGTLVRSLSVGMGGVMSIAFDPNGKLIAISGLGGEVMLWDLTTNRLTSIAPANGLATWCVVFSPDGTRLAGGSGSGTIAIWNLGTGKPQLELEGHASDAVDLAFNADGSRLASAGSDHTVKVWETTLGRELLSLGDHRGTVWSVAFSPDGGQLATGDDEGVKLWETSPASRGMSPTRE